MKNSITIQSFEIDSTVFQNKPSKHFFDALNISDDHPDVIPQARKTLLNLLKQSSGKPLHEDQLSPKQTSSGIRKIFHIFQTNTPYTSAPQEEVARKNYYAKLAYGFHLLGNNIKKEYQNGVLSKQDVYSCLETIGDGGYSCATRWKNVLEELSFGFLQSEEKGLSQFQNELDKQIHTLLYKSSVIEGNRMAETFVSSYNYDYNIEAKPHYISIFKQYLNKQHQLQLHVSPEEDSYISSMREDILADAVKFMKNKDLNAIIFHRFKHLFKEEVLHNPLLYKNIVDVSYSIYSQHPSKDKFDDVSDFLQKHMFNGFSKDIQQRGIVSILKHNNILKINEKEMSLFSFVTLNLEEYIADKNWKKLQNLLSKLPSYFLDSPVELRQIVNFKTSDGNTLINFALENKQNFLVKSLLTLGADINSQTDWNYTPLISAVNSGNIQMVHFLLQHGANPNHISNSNKSILMFCDNEKIASALVNKGATVNVADEFGNTPLHYAIYSGNIRYVDFLLQNHCDPNLKNSDGRTPLHSAAKTDDFETIQLLLQHKVDVNAKDLHGNTPLMYAIKNQSDSKILTLLLQKGSNINLKNFDEKSALIFAIEQENIEAIKLCLDNGADINIRTKDNKSPLDVAKEISNPHINKKITSLLLQYKLMKPKREFVSDVKLLEK